MNYLYRLLLSFFLFFNCILCANDDFSTYLKEFEKENFEAIVVCRRLEIPNRSVTSINYSYTIHSLLTDNSVVKLDDGSLWVIPCYGNHNGIRVELPFQERIKSWDKTNSYKIVKYDLAKDIKFALYNPSANEGERYVAIQLIEASNIASKAIFIIDMEKSGKKLVLSDGTEWTINWYDSFWSSKWKIGDMIIIGYQSANNKNPGMLINANLRKSYCLANTIF